MTQNEFNKRVREAVSEFNDGVYTPAKLAAKILQLSAERVA